MNNKNKVTISKYFRTKNEYCVNTEYIKWCDLKNVLI